MLKHDENPVALVKVDCTEGGKSTCEKFSVSGYPTLKIFRKGEVSSEYNGPRESSKSMSRYLIATLVNTGNNNFRHLKL